ncbi:hypothetical protein ACFOKJ_02555 [Vogesella amnigena]|uniref:Uncharacterized protein n=1 Tax=Vogesella amnigena TaxID=1507449 RepID=A0ABV7TQX9_9NEIS
MSFSIQEKKNCASGALSAGALAAMMAAPPAMLRTTTGEKQ